MILIGLKARLFISKMLICFLHSVFIAGLVRQRAGIWRTLRAARNAWVMIGKLHKRFLSDRNSLFLTSPFLFSASWLEKPNAARLGRARGERFAL